MNEIVKMHNDLADLPLKGFNPSEIDILMALCYKCQDEGETVTLDIANIKSLADYKSKDDKRFYEDLGKTVSKLNALNIRVGENLKEYEQFTLFPKFRVSEKLGTVEVRVSEDFQYLLNEFTGNYTRLELQQSVGLVSRYAKQIYKMLKKFKSTGKWNVRLEDFRTYLDIPKSYKIVHIDDRVIKPALEELQPLFKGLRCEKRYKHEGRGRPRVVGYEWNFQKEQKEQKALSVEDIAKASGWKKTSFCCPECKEIVYEKRLTNDFGEYSLFGHPDFKTGKCQKIFYDRGDLIPVSIVDAEREENENSSEFSTAERSENKARLSKLLGGLFK